MKPFSRLLRSIFLFLLLAALLIPSAPANGRSETLKRPDQMQFDIHGPSGSGKFGSSVTVLPNGNFVVTDAYFDLGGVMDVGAVYLYNGASGALISALTGSTADDEVGSGGVLVLSNGNYVVNSPYWDNGGIINAGAATWGDGTSGVSGVVSSTNSLVGSAAGDTVGYSVIALSNGNYVVSSPYWNNGTIDDAGAVTWGDGTSGVSGVVSSTNSLVGSITGDKVGYNGVTLLSNGNYVVRSARWSNGAAAVAGAVTWGNGASGITGTVSSVNSLVGSTAFDEVGSSGVTALYNGNYVVRSASWNRGAIPGAGAVTWGDGTRGITGTVSSVNSLVGSSASDMVSLSGVIVLLNSNYVVRSPDWDNGAVANVGAVTWGDGTRGITGTISSLNSLVGTTAGDQVGYLGVARLTNDNYVANSPYWDNGAVADVGAVTWGDGTSGVSGVVSSTNSLVGSTANDQVGSGRVYRLSNGNYVVCSPNWDNGTIVNAGAATWESGTSSANGVISAANSLVGSTANDQVGSEYVTLLANDNYVVNSPYWDNGAITNAGALTWGEGTSASSGVVSSTNSLVGDQDGEMVGYFWATALSNGNYVARIPYWDNGAIADVGAVTWEDGTSGVSGVVSSTNSLVGSTANDQVGAFGVLALSNGNYVVKSSYWDNGAIANAGALTWGDGTSAYSGVVSSANSLVGNTANFMLGAEEVFALSNGNYVVSSPWWNNGTILSAGAVTWGDGTSGVSGVISAINSLVGSSNGDQVGYNGVTELSNGNYVVKIPSWNNGAIAFVGAVTWSFGASGVFGPITAHNSVRGTTAYGGQSMVFQYDAVNDQLVVGRPADNIVTMFTKTPLVMGVVVEPASDSGSSAPCATVDYTLQVTNTGNTSDSYNVVVSGNVWTTNAPATIGPISAGATQSLNVGVTIPWSAADGSHDTATVTVTSQSDNNILDSTVLTTTAHRLDADLEVDLSALPNPVTISENLTYTVVITNHGPEAASNVMLVHGLPAGVIYISNDAGCNHYAGVVSCNLGGIANGANKAVHVIVHVITTGVLASTASAAADQSDPDVSNSSDTYTTQAEYRKLFLPTITK